MRQDPNNRSAKILPIRRDVFLAAADREKIAEKLYNAGLYEDILASEDESERGETYSTDEVRSMIDSDLKKLTRASKGKKRTQRIAAA